MRKIRQLSFRPWFPLVIWLLVIGAGFVLLGIATLNGGSSATFESPGSPIYLRGGGIGLLRLPSTVVPRQKVEIYDDGSATRGLNPSQPNKSTLIQLTTSEQQELVQLRVQWCQHVPQFRSLAPNEPFYDVGFRCSASYDVTQSKVPVDMLPPFFTKLLARLPPIVDP